MSTMTGFGHTRLHRDFVPESANRAAAGAFGRRVRIRPAPTPAGELEVEAVLARCRARHEQASSRLSQRGERSRRAGEDMIAYMATGLSILALSAVSVLSVF